MARKDAIMHMKESLVTCRDALRRALAGDLSSLSKLSSQSSGDILDAALDQAQDEINSQLAEVESRELNQIEKALERMKGGQYGLCEVCSGKIKLERLKALPYATMCIDCQRELEREGGGGHGGLDRFSFPDVDYNDRDTTINDIEIDV